LSSKRHHARAADALRTVRFTRRYTAHAEGSVLVEFGDTRVLCRDGREVCRPSCAAAPGLGHR
jgi:ribonuclease PH